MCRSILLGMQLWKRFKALFAGKGSVIKDSYAIEDGLTGFKVLQAGKVVCLKLRGDICTERLKSGAGSPRYDERCLRLGYVFGIVKAVYQQQDNPWMYAEIVSVIPETPTQGVRREYTVLEHEVEAIYHVVNDVTDKLTQQQV